MSTNVVQPQVSRCDPVQHHFDYIYLTPRLGSSTAGLSLSTPMTPQFKLFCTKCGEVRPIS